VPSQQVVATSGRNDARAQVEGDGFWALAIHRPYTSLSDAPASLFIVVCVPKLKESDKNKASVLIPYYQLTHPKCNQTALLRCIN
jgi:hypothetical protein